jgi:oligosaccharide repeat unit polymerase
MTEASAYWFNQTILLLVVQLFIFYYRLGLRMIAHPGTYFAAIWLFSVFSQQILMRYDLALVRDVESIDELNKLVLITSVFFSIWVFFDASKKKRTQIDINLHLKLYKNLIWITFIGAILLMLYTWNSIGISSLNLAHIRDLNTRDKTNYFGTSVDPITSVLKYSQFFYSIICILSGYLLGRIYLLKQDIQLDKKYLYIPLYITLIYVLTTGGRNPLFIGIKYYFIGLCFSLPKFFSPNERRWLLRRIFIIVISLTFFSTYVNETRNEFHEMTSTSDKFNSPVLLALSGGIEYAGAHYYGYQLRNVDTYDEENLGFGYFTFNSIFEIGLPLSSYHGLSATLGDLLGFKENPIDYFYLWENGFEGYYTTNSVYLDLKLDFGFFGAIIFLFFFTYYTQRLFVKVQVGKGVTIITVFWYAMCFQYWAASNFKSSYATGLIGGIIMIHLFSRIFVKAQTYLNNRVVVS